MFDLTGKIAFVTGAASGIGEAVAMVLAKAGAFVYVADINVNDGKRVVETIKADGGKSDFIQLNVADNENCLTAAQTVHDNHGRLDILVNNAGIGHVGNIQQTTAEDFDKLYAVNVRGVFNLTKAFLTKMIERKHGVILNTASIGGIVAIKDRMAYCTMKFAVVGMTKCIALDHALDGIRANCVCPGRIETPFVTARINQYVDSQKAYKEMSATQAIGRMGKPEEIAFAVLYLVSDEAAFVTGTAFEIDGGFSVGK